MAKVPSGKCFIVIIILFIFVLDMCHWIARMDFSRCGLGRPALAKSSALAGPNGVGSGKVIFVAFTGFLGLSGTAPIDRAEESWFGG